MAAGLADPLTRTCDYCGRRMPATARRNARFCSERHRSAYWNRERRRADATKNRLGALRRAHTASKRGPERGTRVYLLPEELDQLTPNAGGVLLAKLRRARDRLG